MYVLCWYEAGGELFTRLRKVRRFTEDEAKFYLVEVLLALDTIHQAGFVYR